MATPKHENFDTFLQISAYVARLLSHPARIKIVLHLLQHGRSSFESLATMLPLASPTVSQHLKMLVVSDLIHLDEETPNSFYEINEGTCEHYIGCLRTLIADFDEQIAKMGR